MCFYGTMELWGRESGQATSGRENPATGAVEEGTAPLRAPEPMSMS